MSHHTLSMACILVLAINSVVLAQSFDVTSPGGNIKMSVFFNETSGKLSYEARAGETVIFENSPLGITTDRADFTSELRLVEARESKIDETYMLPQGKVSTYHNNANEKTILVKKGDQKLEFIFRAYDDGIAFRYAIGGYGKIEIIRETSGFNLAGKTVYWGQAHPNLYGYESVLEKMDRQDAFSLALLCEMTESKHWVLLAQAATYGTYCIPHLKRDGASPNLLKFAFPIDQNEPIKTTLPFESPWRVAVISPDGLSKIVEQTLFENLNPPTEPKLRNAAWIKPGRASFDWFAGDKENWKGWLDFVDEMDWEYHLVDAGWQSYAKDPVFCVEPGSQGYIKDPVSLKEYADEKGRGVIVWQSAPSINTPEKIESVFKNYAEIGFKGAKVDFFDRLPLGETGADYEDTQKAIQVRDDICRIAAKYNIQIIFHGCAIPTGERRRWPHLLGTEAVKGQEGDPNAEHDNCIAYIRNPLGPVDYSPVWFTKGNKTDAYQLATSVVFESGFLIFADLHRNYLNHPSKSFLQKVPSSWDQTRFIEGYPASHTVIARRKGTQWFVGGLTSKQRTINLSFDFLEEGKTYSAAIYKDKDSGLELTIENKELRRGDLIQVQLLDRGGFVIFLERLPQSPVGL